jgi:hypothetical protein
MHGSKVWGRSKGKFGKGRSSSILAAILSMGIAHPGISQPLPACAPPSANEYLLLVANQAPETEAQLTELLPENAAISTCNYLDETVVRVGGFASLEIANAWAQYIQETASLQAFVAQPSSSSSIAAPQSADSPSATEPFSFPSPTQLPSPAPEAAQPAPGGFPSPTSTTSTPTAVTPTVGYNPQPMGEGYAVLVDYFSRPEVAADVQQVTAQSVGLVAYEQNPFLLAAHTPDSATANAVLQTLTQRGFTAIVVDSRRTVLLAPAVIGTAE